MLKLKTIEHKFKDYLYTADAISSLLRILGNYIEQGNFIDIKHLNLSFNFYELDDYPDLNEAKAYIESNYKNKAGDLYFAGDKYESIDTLYDELNGQKIIAELTVEEL